MNGLIWLLVFGAFFYFMMRFGCGSHMVHGGHGGHGNGEHEGHEGHSMGPGSVSDPVCGMEVDPGKGYSEMYQGREYRFCSRTCLDKFDADPTRYLSQKGERP